MEKLILPPDQEGYTVADGSEVVSTILAGGFSRSRRDVIGASSTVSARWTLGRDEFFYIRAFYSSLASDRGAVPFLIDLYMNEPVLTEHEAKFVVGSMQLVEQDGLKFVVSAQLEVKPINNDDYNLAMVVLISNYGFEGALPFLNELEHLVNVELPDSM